MDNPNKKSVKAKDLCVEARELEAAVSRGILDPRQALDLAKLLGGPSKDFCASKPSGPSFGVTTSEPVSSDVACAFPFQRALTSKELGLRAMWPQAVLIQPSVVWREAYMRAIDDSWHDYKQDIEPLRDPEGFGLFVQKIGQGRSWDGSQECHVRWLVDSVSNTLLGRVRLKNIHVQLHDPLWSDPTTFIGGHVGYSICPASRGKKLGTLLLSLALDECWNMELRSCFWSIDNDNEASIKTTLGCGGEKVGESVSPSGKALSKYEIKMRP